MVLIMGLLQGLNGDTNALAGTSGAGLVGA